MAHTRVQHGQSVVLLLELLLFDGVRDVLDLQDASIVFYNRLLHLKVHCIRLCRLPLHLEDLGPHLLVWHAYDVSEAKKPFVHLAMVLQYLHLQKLLRLFYFNRFLLLPAP